MLLARLARRLFGLPLKPNQNNHTRRGLFRLLLNLYFHV